MSREFTLRMDSDHYVEEGFLTKTSLSHLLNHAVQNCPRLEKVVGEWTKVGLVRLVRRLLTAGYSGAGPGNSAA